MTPPFKNRRDAGQQLAAQLLQYADHPRGIVLGLPRGGVPVVYEVAKRLYLPLDVLIVRKLGVPGQEELAFGALTVSGALINLEMVNRLDIASEEVEEVIQRERRELLRREQAYHRGLPPVFDFHSRLVILIDDGLATGSTLRAAIEAIREKKPARIVVAVPVAPFSVCNEFKEEADEMVCLLRRESFYAVGLSYEDFSPTPGKEVEELLRRNRERMKRGHAPGNTPPTQT